MLTTAFDQIHTPPAVIPVDVDITSQERDEEADCDGHLVQGDQHAPPVGRRDLGDVDTLTDGRQRDGETHHHSGNTARGGSIPSYDRCNSTSPI